MKICVPDRLRESLLVELTAQGGVSELTIETFSSMEVPSPCFPNVTPSETTPVIMVFGDSYSFGEKYLGSLRELVELKPDETIVAVRNQDVAENLRRHEIHTDVIPLDSTASGFVDCLQVFLPTFTFVMAHLVGNRTEWTLGVLKLLNEAEMKFANHTVSYCETHLRNLFLVGAFDFLAVGDWADVERIEGLTGMTIENLASRTRILACSKELRVRLATRSIHVEHVSLASR